MKKKITFKLGLLIYALVLLAIMGIALIGLSNVLKKYEASQAYNTVESFCKGLENDLTFNSLANEEKYIDKGAFSRFENEEDIRAEYIKFFSGKKAEYTLSSTSRDPNAPVYIIHCGEEVFGEVKLKIVSEKVALDMLSIAEWEIESFTPELASIGTAYAVTVPEEFTVSVNGTKLEKDDIASQKNGEILYLVSGLTKEPQIQIKNTNNDDVKYTVTKSEDNQKIYKVEAEYTIFSFQIPSAFTVDTKCSLRKKVNKDMTTYSMVVEKIPTVEEMAELVEIKDFTGDVMNFTDKDGIPAPAYYAYELNCPDIFKVKVGDFEIDLEKGEKTAITEKQYSNVKNLVKTNIYTVKTIFADASDKDSKARLSITDADNNSIEYSAENGVVSTVVADVVITIPENFKLAYDGKELGITPVEGTIKEYADITAYTSVPKSLSYTIPKQYAPVKLELTNNLGEKETVFAVGKVEKLEQAGRPAIYEAGYPEQYKAVADAVNPIEFGQKWSYFMTDDLADGSRGYNTIRKYVVNGSYLDTNAKKWATGVDINFIGRHIFDNPPFSQVWYKNVVFLSDTAFYCDVHFIKSFTVTSNNTHRDDEFYQRVYYVYGDDDNDGVATWQVAAMMEIVE